MKKNIFFMLLFLAGITANMTAQVIIGSATDNPNPSAVLDLQSTDKGLLIPRVALTALDSPDPLTGKVAGMIVYNTGEGALKAAGVYYHDGINWILLDPAGVSSVTGTAPVVSSGGTTPNISLAPGTANGQVLKYVNGQWVTGGKLPETGTLNDVEGNTYSYACFGAAGCWMTENLRVTKYAHGTDVITHKNGFSNSSDWNKREWEYAAGKDSINNKHAYGLLYTWAAATNRTNQGADAADDNTQYQGICPDGWHLPSAVEWTQLMDVVAADVNRNYSSNTARGLALRSSRPSGVGGEQIGKSNATSNNGFDILPTGTVTGVGTVEANPTFWTGRSTAANTAAGSHFRLTSAAATVETTDIKVQLFPVRCKKN